MEHSLILLVDDNPANLQILGNLLEGEYRTAIARNGFRALEFVQKKPPDLILLDIMMPEMDGFEVCQTLQASPETQEIPIIFLTAKTETEDIVKGFELGAVDYVTKPFQKQELLARVKTHLALRRAKQELQELNATKDKFFSIIAHDLRGPVSSLQNLSELLIENIERYDKENLIKMLMMQHDASKNLFGLLENLLTWSRIQQGMLEYHPRRLNLRDIIVRNISLLTPHAEQKQITLRNLLEELIVVYADPDMIDTVVRNLISNALKFTKAGGNVEVSAAQDEHGVEVSVSDNGIGMNEKGISRLFRVDEKYRRIGTAKERGTGLGLILCKEFVERNRGRIWVESEVEKGSIFRFTLPKESME